MLDGIKNTIWNIFIDALNNIVHAVFMAKKDEWKEELTAEISSTDSDWVKTRDAVYLSLIDKITQEEEKDS